MGEPTCRPTPGGTILPAYDGGKAIGVLTRPDGLETTIVSGFDGPSRGTMGIPGMHNRIKSHVEAHAAVLMRRECLVEAALYINRVPCPTVDRRVPGCMDSLHRMLPEGAKLKVVGPDGFDRSSIGSADPPDCVIVGVHRGVVPGSLGDFA